MKKEKTVFKYGGVTLSILNQTAQVPERAGHVILSKNEEKAIATGIENDYPILLIGEAGTGKTSIARLLAYKRKQGYTRINMHGYATPDDLIGSKSVKNGATYHEQGILTKAMLEGHIVVLDEINATPADCTFILHGLLDDDRQISLPNGEVIKPHKDFRLIATMNPDYEGTKAMNRALIDRFTVILFIDTLIPKKEVELLTQRTEITLKEADQLVLTAWIIRKAYKENKTMMYPSTRTLLQWGSLIKKGIKMKEAYEMTVIRKAQPQEQTAFMDYFHSVFKTKVDEENPDAPLLTTKGEMKELQKKITEAQKAREVTETLYNQEKEKSEGLQKELEQLGSKTPIKKESTKIFKQGDLVEAHTPQGDIVKGSKGKIIEICLQGTDNLLKVEFIGNISGHDGSGRGKITGKMGHTWFFLEKFAENILKVID